MLPSLTEMEIGLMSPATRTRLIGQIVTIVRGDGVPPEARQAGLTLVGWLARRMPHDEVDDRTVKKVE